MLFLVTLLEHGIVCVENLFSTTGERPAEGASRLWRCPVSRRVSFSVSSGVFAGHLFQFEATGERKGIARQKGKRSAAGEWKGLETRLSRVTAHARE